MKDQFTETMKEIELFITYSVKVEEQQLARAFLTKIKENKVALAVLKDFYTSLPGVEEEPVIGLFLLDSKQGVLLLGLDALHHKYLYYASHETVGCVGYFEEGIEDPEVLAFFDFSSNKEFKKKYPDLKKLDSFGLENVDEKAICPVCFVEEGELHHFGCVVEVCPWCEGQLSNCNCRFDQMKVEEFESEDDLAEFEELLEAKGRIAFSREQVPSYPSDSDEPLTV